MRRTFSPTDAAVEGFRIVRRRPDVLVIWTGLVLLTAAVSVGLVWSSLAPDFASVISALQSRVRPDVLQPVAEKVRGTQLLLTPVSATLHAVLGAAILRAVLRPDSRSVGYLGFGGDEFRVFLVQMVCGLITAGVLIAWVLFVVVFTAIGIAAAGLHSGEIGKAVLWAVVIGGVVGVVGIVYVAIRLSLAAPMTFADREFRLFESWGRTRGQVWRLAGAYVLAYFLQLVVALALMVTGIVAGGLVFVASGGPAILTAHGDALAILKAAWPAALVGLLPVSLASVISTLVLQATAASAYLALSRDAA